MGATEVGGPVIAQRLAEPHHDGSELYVDRLGDSAEVRLRAPAGAAEAVFLRYLKDGEPRVVEAAPTPHTDGDVLWRAELSLRNPSVTYRWLLTGGQLGYRWVNATGSYPYEVTPADDFRLNAEPAPADWHLSSVGYEIFLDRFASSGAIRAQPEWAVPRDWNDPPDPVSRNTNREFYGGDLGGVEQHLDHIESLGANVIWLTAFFPAPSNHRYEPSSFDRVDPVLGGDDALESLIRAAHARGIRLFGDLSLDHCGDTHPWFKRAQEEPSSPERNFFLFDGSETHGYASWRGTSEQPRFDWRSEELRARLGGSVRHWLDLGLDGWRIGAADMVGRYRDLDLNAEVARWLRSEAGDAPLVAEYWDDYRPDLDGRGWHGVMNYAGFLRPLWWWLRGDTIGPEAYDVFTSARAPTYDGRQASTVMQASRANIPWDATLHSWLPLDTHDTPRFSTVVGTRERHLVGVGLQMSAPGVPWIFAGDEIGLEGTAGRDRRTIPWDQPERWDTQLLEEYRTLASLRRSSDALARGSLRYAHVSDDAILYLRESRLERLLCLAARAPHDPIAVPFANLETLYGEDARDGLLPSDGPAFHVWRVAGR